MTGVVCFLVIIGLKKLNPLIPRNAVVVAVATIATWGFKLNESWSLSIIGPLPEMYPHLQLPDFSRSPEYD